MKKLQEKVKKFTQRNKIENTSQIATLDSLAELGEVASELLRSSKYGKEDFKKTKNLELELGDAFYSLITLANACGVDLENALELVLRKYKKRFQKSKRE